MVPNKLVHSAELPLEHERAYARLFGKLEYVLSIMYMHIAILCIIELLYAEMCIIFSIFMWDFAEK